MRSMWFQLLFQRPPKLHFCSCSCGCRS